jgi:hypothetical protein
MVLERDKNLVEAQFKDSQDRLKKSDSTVIFNFLFELF